MRVVKTRILFQNAVMPLIIANVVLFLIQMIAGNTFTNALMLNQNALMEPWRFLTAMFLHSPSFPLHLFINMYVLFMFGTLIERRIGTKRFLLIYFLAGLVANIATFSIYPAALGASGAIMGILGVTIILMPDLRVLLFFIIPMSLRTAAILLVIVEVLGTFGLGIPGVANLAHLVGLGCGLIYGFYLKQKGDSFKRKFIKRKPRSRNTSSLDYQSSIEMNDEDLQNYYRYGRL